MLKLVPWKMDIEEEGRRGTYAPHEVVRNGCPMATTVFTLGCKTYMCSAISEQ
jgi:hypothetical protein